MRRKYYLHQRKGVFYAELVCPETGRKLSARSTGATTRDEALLRVSEWLRDGIPAGRQRKPRPVGLAFSLAAILEAVKKAPLDPAGAEAVVQALKARGLVAGNFSRPDSPAQVPFLDFLRDAWDPEKSGFIKEKAAYGHPLTKRHVIESSGLISRYWDVPEFREIPLADIERNAMKDHLFSLRARGLTPGTVNKALAAVSAPLAWAVKQGLIQESPAAGIPRFSGTSRERGILTSAEIESLAKLEWADRRARAAFFVALTCGLRLSEVLGLRVQDIAEDRLLVRHSYSWADGLTCLKNKEAREVSVLPELRDELRSISAENPHGLGGKAFIFFGLMPDRPIDGKVLADGYTEALAAIGIGPQARKGRNLVFHGLRHLYATTIVERVGEARAMKATGHRTAAMLQHYAGHQTEESVQAVGAAVGEAFGRIVKFRKAANE